MTDSALGRAIARRDVLRAAALGAGAAALAACVPAAPSGSTAAPFGSATPGAPSAPSGTATPSPTPAATPSPEPSAVSTLPLRERIARLLIVGFKGMTVDEAPWIRDAIAEQGLGGVILFDRHQASGGPRNVESPAQVTALVAGLRALAPDRAIIVSIDQEGGKVTRLSPAHGFPAVASQEAIGPDGDTAVKAWADALTATLAGVGINLNFASVVDLNLNPTNPAIGALDRAFSADPAIVSRDAEIEVQAHRERGVRTALKHFPGLGSATANTDFGVADVTATWRDIELDPYRDLIGLGLVDAIMAAHVVNGRFDRNAPASLSKATVTDLLRDQLGYSGVVVTDDLQAAAITEAFGFDDAIALALEAGNDLLLFANQQVYDPALPTKVVDLVERLIGQGRLTESRIDESVARVERLFRDAVGSP